MITPLLWKLRGPRVPRVELGRFKKVDFFPPYGANFENFDSICIGSKSRTIGDALMLSTLPSKLRKRYPHLKVYTYPRGFNPVVFYGHPDIEGVQYLPDRLYGDDCNWGEGHLIQVKERFFGLEVSGAPRPELHLTSNEKSGIEQNLHGDKPLCLIHPWGKTRSQVLSTTFWEDRVRACSHHVRVWQVGIEGHQKIAGCENHFLLPKAFHHARKLFALMSRADLFVGVDSGPMHVARAFGVPSLILTDFGIPPDEIFQARREQPYYSHSNRLCGFLYEQNTHCDVGLTPVPALIATVDDFMKKPTNKT